MKLSDQLKEKATACWRKRVDGRDLSELKQADLLAAELIGALLWHVDTEAERRAKFEADVLERLAKLERGER